VKYYQSNSETATICHVLPLYTIQEIYIISIYIMDHAVLYYKLEGRGFDCNFFYIILDSASVDYLEIWEPQPHGTLRACTGMDLPLNNLSLEIQPIFPYYCYLIMCNDICRPIQVFEENT
jgi:hypothetical protein